jgi:hypothetical protein
MDFKSKPLGATHFVANRHWGKRLWGIGYGAWSTGNITEEVVEEYLKCHKSSTNDKSDFKLDYGTFSPHETYALSVHSRLVVAMLRSVNG